MLTSSLHQFSATKLFQRLIDAQYQLFFRKFLVCELLSAGQALGGFRCVSGGQQLLLWAPLVSAQVLHCDGWSGNGAV